MVSRNVHLGIATMIAHILSEPLSRFIVQMILIIVFSRAVGLVMRAIGQPLVIAEITAGVMLGPSLFGWLLPGPFKLLFPEPSLRLLQMFSQVGLIVFMFLIGLELDPKLLRGRGRASLLISQVGMFFPFGLGLVLALYFYGLLAPPGVRFAPFALFMGIAMSVTAFPVLARILSERRLLRSKVGAMAITCAAIGDVAAWCLLAFVVSFVKATGLMQAARTTGYTLLYIGVMIYVVRPFMRRFGARGGSREALTQNMVAGALVLLLASSFITEVIGIHALFGAFLFGAIIPKESGFVTTLAEKLEDFAVVFLLPMFFAFSGLRTQIGLLSSGSSWLLCGLVIAVACIGKFGGVTLSARLMGQSWRESSALGVLMNTRGLMELVVLNIGLDLGVISPLLFTMLVLMALLTTFMTTPVLQLIYPHAELTRELAEADTPAPGDKSPFCMLLAVSYTSAASGMLILAEALCRRQLSSSRIYALKLLRPTERTSNLLGDAQSKESPTAAFGPLLFQAEQQKLPLQPLSFVSSQPARDICDVAKVKGAELLLLGWHRPLFNRAALGGTVNEVLEQAKCDVGVLVDRGLVQIQRVLVPYHGTDDDRVALALAHRLSEQSNVDVTVLHVVPPGRTDKDGRIGVVQHVNEVFREPGNSGGDTPGPLVHIKVVEAEEPAEAALREVMPLPGAENDDRPGYDLVLISVGSDWGLEQRQFGINQEYFIRKCPTSLLVVHKRDQR
jgi:Kef-type K+ transport system membrane component KefB/nucleotide-binding universal stress UspA family protein